MIFGIKIYEVTIISKTILITAGLIASMILFFLIKANYSKTYNTKTFLYPLAQSIFSAGLLTVSLLLVLNKSLSKKELKSKKFRIEKIGYFSSRSKQTYAIINYSGLKKQLIFKTGTEINSSNIIELKVSKGFLGFDIIRNVNIIEK